MADLMQEAAARALQQLLSDPAARQRMVAGFARRTQLTPEQEARFQAEATKMGHDPRTFSDPTYDMRAAWLQGNLNPPSMHGDSRYKGIGDERLFLPIGPGGANIETRTAREGPVVPQVWTGTSPSPQYLNLHNIISGVMTGR